MKEEWRDIPGWEGLYQASSFGRIRSLSRREFIRNRYGECSRVKRGRVMRPALAKGYLRVQLRGGAKSLSTGVHKLVCLAFHGPQPCPGAVTAHADGDPLNNQPDNLRWASQAENAADMIGHGTVRRGEAIEHLAKLTEADVLEIRRQYVPGNGKSLAKMYGVSGACISAIVRRLTWKHI